MDTTMTLDFSSTLNSDFYLPQKYLKSLLKFSSDRLECTLKLAPGLCSFFSEIFQKFYPLLILNSKQLHLTQYQIMSFHRRFRLFLLKSFRFLSRVNKIPLRFFLNSFTDFFYVRFSSDVSGK